MRVPVKLIAALAGLALASPALAQAPAAGSPPSSQSLNTAPGCNQSGRAEAATPPARNSGDGTAPGNAGSTGWSGGTGGSQIGTNPSGATDSSPTWQPPTARGLDPMAAAQPSARC